MSWQAYVDDHLLVELPHGGHLESAAIIGQDGGVWAQSSNFPEIATEEVESILGGISNQAQLAQSGLFLGGTKYLVVAGDEGSVIRGKKGQSGEQSPSLSKECREYTHALCSRQQALYNNTNYLGSRYQHTD